MILRPLCPAVPPLIRSTKLALATPFLRVSLSALALLCISSRTFGQDLFVTSEAQSEVKRYNGTTGAFVDTFVTAGSGGLAEPNGITFGPDGNIYVTGNLNGTVKRYNGINGSFI